MNVRYVLDRFPWLIPLAAGLAIAAGTFVFTHSGAAAACVCVGCLCTWGTSIWLVEWETRTAQTRLRNLDVRGFAPNEAGIFQQLLGETFDLLSKSGEQVLNANQARTESEARFHVRQKQIRRLESALYSLPEPLLITDGCDKLSFWNPAAAELFRNLSGSVDAKSPASVAGAASENGAAPNLEKLPELQRLLKETRARSVATMNRSLEFELNVGGTAKTFRAHATNLLDEDGSELGVAVVLRDIGAEKREKSRHAEFVSSVSHELKTPMASIKAFIEMLIDGDVEDHDEQLRLYGFIDVQVDRLTRLVNNMLNLARIESGVIKVQREDCGLSDILDKALQVVQPMADEKQIRLIPQFSELYLPVHVDRDLFGQAVINLLSNAVKYTPAGGEVRLRSRMTDNEALIDVQDNGLGIPEEDMNRLFERFFRVERNNKAAAGTGLGLALVRYIVHSIHNGRVTVQSKVNEGSCFSIAIPLGHRDQARRKLEPQFCAS